MSGKGQPVVLRLGLEEGGWTVVLVLSGKLPSRTVLTYKFLGTSKIRLNVYEPTYIYIYFDI